MKLGRITFGQKNREAGEAMHRMFEAGYKAVSNVNSYESLLRRVLMEWHDKDGDDDPWDVERWTQTIRDIEAAMDKASDD